jgi:hypothetical protein
LPDPDTPVTTISRLCGRSSEMPLRLWVRAPRILMVRSTPLNVFFSNSWMAVDAGQPPPAR